MLWKIIKNNYRNEENMFSHRFRPTHLDNIKYCAVPLQSYIYDINYRTFLLLLKRFSFPFGRFHLFPSTLIRCNGK